MNNQHWPMITKGAVSSDGPTRRHSVHQAVTELEKALKASGVKKKKGQSVADAFLALVEADQALKDKLAAGPIPSSAFSHLLKAGIHARNASIHDGRNIDQSNCEWFVEILQIAWELLRERFVTGARALELAGHLSNAKGKYQTRIDSPLQSTTGALSTERSVTHRRVRRASTTSISVGVGPVFSNVYLFGSVARGARNPGDIDLLLATDIACPWIGFDYGHHDRTAAKLLLRTLDAQSEGNHAHLPVDSYGAAIDCGWINLTPVSPEFGSNTFVTAEIASAQRDPFFFLNLAADALRYEPSARVWTRDLAFPLLEELREIHSKLSELGILSSPAHDQMDVPQELHVTLALNAGVAADISALRRNGLDKVRFSDQVPAHSLHSTETIVNRLFYRGLNDERGSGYGRLPKTTSRPETGIEPEGESKDRELPL